MTQHDETHEAALSTACHKLMQGAAPEHVSISPTTPGHIGTATVYLTDTSRMPLLKVMHVTSPEGWQHYSVSGEHISHGCAFADVPGHPRNPEGVPLDNITGELVHLIDTGAISPLVSETELYAAYERFFQKWPEAVQHQPHGQDYGDTSRPTTCIETPLFAVVRGENHFHVNGHHELMLYRAKREPRSDIPQRYPATLLRMLETAVPYPTGHRHPLP